MKIEYPFLKLVSLILIISLINLLGCYSSEAVTIREYKKIEKEKGKPETIQVITGNNKEYHFSDSGYSIENDTLSGRGFTVTNHQKEPFEGKIPIRDITTIKISEFDSGSTILAVLTGIATVLLIYVAADWSSWGN